MGPGLYDPGARSVGIPGRARTVRATAHFHSDDRDGLRATALDGLPKSGCALGRRSTEPSAPGYRPLTQTGEKTVAQVEQVERCDSGRRFARFLFRITAPAAAGSSDRLRRQSPPGHDCGEEG